MTGSIPAFSTAWAEALLHAINADEAFRAAARGWTNVVALVVAEVAAVTNAVQVDLNAGTCRAAAAVHPDEVTAPFVLAADLAIWREIIGGSGDPILAVAAGKVKLTRGSLGTLMLHSRAAKALLVCARQIDTLWPSNAWLEPPSPRAPTP